MLLQQTIPVKLPTFSATVLSSASIRASKLSRFIIVRLVNIRRVHVVFAVKLCSAKRRRNVRVRKCISRVFRQRRIWWNVRGRLVGLIALTEPISGVVCRLEKVFMFLAICLREHRKSVPIGWTYLIRWQSVTIPVLQRHNDAGVGTRFGKATRRRSRTTCRRRWRSWTVFQVAFGRAGVWEAKWWHGEEKVVRKRLFRL